MGTGRITLQKMGEYERGVVTYCARFNGSWLTFNRSPRRILVLNTETPPGERRRGQAGALVRWLKEHAKGHGIRIDWGIFSIDGMKYIRHVALGTPKPRIVQGRSS